MEEEASATASTHENFIQVTFLNPQGILCEAQNKVGHCKRLSPPNVSALFSQVPPLLEQRQWI